LWDYLCTYCYLLRLANYDVLEGAIRDGLNSKEYFAFAAGVDGGRYIEFKYGVSANGKSIDRSGLLVKPAAAEKQLEEDEEKAAKIKINFHMSASLDVTRIGDVQRLVDEVIHHFSSVDGCRVEISLEVNAKVPDGLPQETVRTVFENCRTLKVENFEFIE